MSTAECSQREESASKNGACNTSGDDGCASTEDSLLDVRKSQGLFGRSASYLQMDESDESGAEKKVEDDSVKQSGDNSEEKSHENVITGDVEMENVDETAGMDLVEELAAADADMDSPSNEKEDESGKEDETGNDITCPKEQVTLQSTNTSIFETKQVSESGIHPHESTSFESEVITVQHVLESGTDEMEYEKSRVESVDEDGEATTVEVSSTIRVTQEVVESAETNSSLAEESNMVTSATKIEIDSSGISKSATKEKSSTEANKESDVVDYERKEGAIYSEQTESSECSHPVVKIVLENVEKGGDVEDPAAERRRSLRTRKDDAAAEERRKSLRPARNSPARTPTPSTKKKGRGQKTPLKTTTEEENTKTPPSSGRKSKKACTSSESKEQTQKGAKKKRSGRGDTSDKDPFSFDNFNNHPEPLRNIQMERQSFGGYKFTKSPTESSATRYEKTEQTASERRSNLLSMLPHHQTQSHKSLSEIAASPSSLPSSSTKRKRKMTDEEREKEAHHNEEEAAEEENDRSMYEFKTPSSRKRKTGSLGRTPTSEPRRVKKKQEPPNLSVDEQFEVDRRDNEHSPYRAGARILALWDRLYYAAHVTGDRDASGRYQVSFVDGCERRLVVTGIVPLGAIREGQACYTQEIKDGEELLDEVTVIKSPSQGDPQQWFQGEFIVKSVEKENTYSTSWKTIVLDSGQAQELQVEKVNTIREVAADNIDLNDSRRTRNSRHSLSYFDAAPKDAKNPRRRATPSEETGGSTRKRKTVEGRSPASTKSKQNKKTKKETRIFSDLTFIVTSAVRTKSKDDEPLTFSKREVRQMIESRGGTVVDDLAKVSEERKMFLIADTHYRTHKYLSALARSVPCVSHQWIRDCVKNNELLDHSNYMLPAGLSIITGEVAPWHSQNGTLLEGKKVHIHSKNVFKESALPGFVDIWSPMVVHMGGEVISKLSDEFDILLTDPTCPDEVLEKARSIGAIIVSSEWIIQSIIHGKLPAADAHERFRYDFTEKAVSTSAE